MASSERQWLTRQLAEVLVPALQRAGFVQLPLEGEDAKAPAIRSAFPFGRFRRNRPAGIEQVEIQLDKNKPAAFRINFGRFPAGGIRHATGPVREEDVWIHYLDDYGALYDGPWTRRWFACKGRSGAAPTEADYRELVEQVAALLPEVEQALDPKASLPWRSHVRRVRA